ncbi:hypothetical protein B4Q13_24110, partial [Lacticaseibacillus rhamnosus]
MEGARRRGRAPGRGPRPLPAAPDLHDRRLGVQARAQRPPVGQAPDQLRRDHRQEPVAVTGGNSLKVGYQHTLMTDDRSQTTKERLKKGQKQRSTQRRARERNSVFRVSLVGYTTAGKSTLFNSLVKARTYAADQLFATRDTT